MLDAFWHPRGCEAAALELPHSRLARGGVAQPRQQVDKLVASCSLQRCVTCRRT